MKILTIRDLVVSAGGKRIIDGINWEVERGTIVGLTGKNGSGKTTLAQVLMGNEQLRIEKGQVIFEGKDLLTMSADERAKAGIYVSWQQPMAVPGVSIFSLAKAMLMARGEKINNFVEFREYLEELLTKVGLPKDYVKRSVNEGMSGGERKRLELMWALLLSPKLLILDEIDSGLDEEGRRRVGQIVRELRKQGVTVAVISHYREFLRDLGIKQMMVMDKGKIK